MSLRQKIENHFQSRSGEGSLVGVIVATVMLSTIVAAGTEWYLSINKSTGRMQEQMAAQSYAYNEWQNVLAEDYDSLSSKARKNVSDKFDIKRDVGVEKNVSGSGKEKDVVITVYRKGTDQVAYAMHSGKARPTMDNYYTKAQADAMVDKKLKELIRLENEDKNVKLPEGKALYAYLNGQKLPLSSQADSPLPSMFSDQGGYYKFPNGLIMQWGHQPTFHDLFEDGREWRIQFPIPFPHKCFMVDTAITYQKGTGIPAGNSYPRDITSVGFVLVDQEWSGGWEQHATNYWFAMGY